MILDTYFYHLWRWWWLFLHRLFLHWLYWWLFLHWLYWWLFLHWLYWWLFQHWLYWWLFQHWLYWWLFLHRLYWWLFLLLWWCWLFFHLLEKKTKEISIYYKSNNNHKNVKIDLFINVLKLIQLKMWCFSSDVTLEVALVKLNQNLVLAGGVGDELDTNLATCN